jgi:hypothetical protein
VPWQDSRMSKTKRVNLALQSGGVESSIDIRARFL